jgi:hypothetical protein
MTVLAIDIGRRRQTVTPMFRTTTFADPPRTSMETPTSSRVQRRTSRVTLSFAVVDVAGVSAIVLVSGPQRIEACGNK